MKTYADLLSVVPEHLVADAEVPILGGLQRQGDLFVVPIGTTGQSGMTPILVPRMGVDVIEGRNGGHAHTLVADGPVMWTPAARPGTDLGIVTVPEGAQAFLLHPEHGASGIATGEYLLRRQREQGEVQRIVAD